MQSLFNPALRPQVERFVWAFAERYRETGVIESLLLGVTGIYGESIYPAGPEGGWTARVTGGYHNHFGWWAGDPCAAQAFRKAMSDAYGRVGHLNVTWGTTYATFDDIATFHPDRAPNDRARADLAEWYQKAMTDWSIFWVKTVGVSQDPDLFLHRGRRQSRSGRGFHCAGGGPCAVRCGLEDLE